MLLGGIIATYYSYFSPIITIIGAFVCFTSTSTLIELDQKRIRNSDNLFGIIPIGKWIDIKPDMKIGLKNNHRGYRAYIKGTQKSDYRDQWQASNPTHLPELKNYDA